jgi:hypothetical protein
MAWYSTKAGMTVYKQLDRPQYGSEIVINTHPLFTPFEQIMLDTPDILPSSNSVIFYCSSPHRHKSRRNRPRPEIFRTAETRTIRLSRPMEEL